MIKMVVDLGNGADGLYVVMRHPPSMIIKGFS